MPELTDAERFPGGDATTSLSNDEAFGQAPESIQRDFAADANFKSGNQIFRNAHDGEGPLLNARTCQGCHTKDGRGAVPPNQETPMDSMVVRLGLGQTEERRTIADPNYGRQLQTFGLASFVGDDVGAGLSAFGEWRTAPLWGLGLATTVNERATYLHDGRARTIAEAVLWHGGEAERSRDAFVAMPAADREALLAFLESL